MGGEMFSVGVIVFGLFGCICDVQGGDSFSNLGHNFGTTQPYKTETAIGRSWYSRPSFTPAPMKPHPTFGGPGFTQAPVAPRPTFGGPGFTQAPVAPRPTFGGPGFTQAPVAPRPTFGGPGFTQAPVKPRPTFGGPGFTQAPVAPRPTFGGPGFTQTPVKPRPTFGGPGFTQAPVAPRPTFGGPGFTQAPVKPRPTFGGPGFTQAPVAPRPTFGGPGFTQTPVKPRPTFGGPGFTQAPVAPRPTFGGPGFTQAPVAPHPTFGGPGFTQAPVAPRPTFGGPGFTQAPVAPRPTFGGPGFTQAPVKPRPTFGGPGFTQAPVAPRPTFGGPGFTQAPVKPRPTFGGPGFTQAPVAPRPTFGGPGFTQAPVKPRPTFGGPGFTQAPVAPRPTFGGPGFTQAPVAPRPTFGGPGFTQAPRPTFGGPGFTQAPVKPRPTFGEPGFTKAPVPPTTVVVPTPKPDAVKAYCGESSVQLEVDMDLLGIGHLIQPSDITLGGCGPVGQDQSSHLLFETELHACGSVLMMIEDSLVYMFTLHYQPKALGATPIIRTSSAVVGIQCHYIRLHNVSSNALKPTWIPYHSTLSAEDIIVFSLRLMADNWQTERMSNVFYLGDLINIEASVVQANHVPLNVFVDSCVATLDPDMNAVPRYAFIEKGCLMDSKLTNSRSQFLQRVQADKLQFQLDAFKFAQQARSTIYIFCRLKAHVIMPGSEGRACSFLPGNQRWISASGYDQSCSCCDTGCAMRKGRSLNSGVQYEGGAVLGPLVVQEAAKDVPELHGSLKVDHGSEGSFVVVMVGVMAAVGLVCMIVLGTVLVRRRYYKPIVL